MRLLAYLAILVGAFVFLSLVSFWLAVRPPRIAIPLRPEDFRLTVEDVRIRADDGIELAAWLLPRPGAPTVVLLHGYPAEKADLLPLAAALAPRFTVLLLDQLTLVLAHAARSPLIVAINSTIRSAPLPSTRLRPAALICRRRPGSNSKRVILSTARATSTC